MNKVLESLKVLVSLVLYVAILSLSIIIFVVAVLMLPLRLVMSPRSFTRLYLYMADYYWKFAVWYGETWLGIQLHLYGDEVPMRENAFVISNHRWGVDFIIYWMFAVRKGRLGCLKLLAKDWLKFFPGFGWGGYLLDFVFLKRDWQTDKKRIGETFHRLKTRDLPFWLLSHVEGTRMTPDKLKAGQEFARQRGLPVMEETLLPRTKGFVSIIQELRNMKPALVLYDTTLMYEDVDSGKFEYAPGSPVGGPNMFSFFIRPSSICHLHVRRITMDELPADDAGLEAWLMDAFVLKIKLLAEFRITRKFPNPCPQQLAYPEMKFPL